MIERTLQFPDYVQIVSDSIAQTDTLPRDPSVFIDKSRQFTKSTTQGYSHIQFRVRIGRENLSHFLEWLDFVAGGKFLFYYDDTQGLDSPLYPEGFKDDENYKNVRISGEEAEIRRIRQGMATGTDNFDTYELTLNLEYRQGDTLHAPPYAVPVDARNPVVFRHTQFDFNGDPSIVFSGEGTLELDDITITGFPLAIQGPGKPANPGPGDPDIFGGRDRLCIPCIIAAILALIALLTLKEPEEIKIGDLIHIMNLAMGSSLQDGFVFVKIYEDFVGSAIESFTPQIGPLSVGGFQNIPGIFAEQIEC